MPWVLGQLLTKKPKSPQSVISDLFIWRCDDSWQTYFELLDISALLGENENHSVKIVFFDKQGNVFYKHKLELKGLQRQVLDISEILERNIDMQSNCTYGTFCIFHQEVPYPILKSNAFLSERGYSSFRYKGAPLKSFVHGNLDAISEDLKTNIIVKLGGSSFLNRQFSLQYLLRAEVSHEMGFVNTSSTDKKIAFKVIEVSENTDKVILMTEKSILKPGACLILPIGKLGKLGRLIVTSKMIMARPVVFCLFNEKMDVFHG